jgi:beta-galactosidase
VTDATPAVTVRVKGAGRLIGLDTGDLDYGGLFKAGKRAAYQGRLLATVQRTAPAGEIRISAATPGLPSATFASLETATATDANSVPLSR